MICDRCLVYFEQGFLGDMSISCLSIWFIIDFKACSSTTVVWFNLGLWYILLFLLELGTLKVRFIDPRIFVVEDFVLSLLGNDSSHKFVYLQIFESDLYISFCDIDLGFEKSGLGILDSLIADPYIGYKFNL